MFMPAGTATENHGCASHAVAQLVVDTRSVHWAGSQDPGSGEGELMAGISIGIEQSIWLSGMGGGAGAK